MKKSSKTPPPLAIWLLNLCSKNDSEFNIADTLQDLYLYTLETDGKRRAVFWYWRQVLWSIPKNIVSRLIWRFVMFNNYLKIALRNIRKYKGYASINIAGLAMGMAVCILIFLWVQDEWSFDRFHQNSDVIYRVTLRDYDSSGDYFPAAVTPWPLAEALKKDFPEVVESARLRILTNRLISYNDKKFYEKNFVAVDPSFLKMFSLPLAKGDISTALKEPHTILITEETAVRYFGNEDPMGKVLTYNNEYDFKVTGVLRDIRNNSHLKIDFLVPFESTLREFGWPDEWWEFNYTTYIQVEKNASIQQISQKTSDYQKNIQPETSIKYILQPLTDIHLRSYYDIDLYGQTENKAIYVYAFSVIALFVLLIACINFMNLSTARSEKRLKEVGLRKVVGATRNNIITQFYGESLFMTVLSFLIAILLVYLLLPAFNNVSGKMLTIHSMKEPIFLIGLLGILLITGLASGSYPAFVQSSYKPVDTIKGIILRTSSKSGKSIFRRMLVVIQFTLSIMLIVGTLAVYKQIDYMLNKELGYEKESIVYIRKRANLRTQYDAFKSELLRNPNIRGVTSSSDVPTRTVHATGSFFWEGKDPETSFLIHQFSVDHDYIKTFNMKIAAGRDFSKKFPMDDSTKSFIVNESAVKAMGLENPVGTKFWLYRHTGQIVGVIEDFHYKSLQKEIEPLVLRIDPSWDNYIFVKFHAEHTEDVIATLQRVYNSFNSDYPLEYTFLDEAVGRLYSSEQKTREIFNFFTMIAIIISCLGLYGLAAYMAERKTKEIGVRKVLGASIMNIVGKLSKEFILLIITANLIAWPMAYFFMHKWLQNFAYRIDLSIWIFVLSGLAALVIALVTVSYQSIKAARANPVDSLRYE